MAEIKLERKRSGTAVWLIVLLLLILVAVAAYFLMDRTGTTTPQTETAPTTQTLRVVPFNQLAA